MNCVLFLGDELARSSHLSSDEAGDSTLVFGLELLTEGADRHDFGYRPHALTRGPIVPPDLRTDFLGHVGKIDKVRLRQNLMANNAG